VSASFQERANALRKLLDGMQSSLDADGTLKAMYKDVAQSRGFEKSALLVLINVIRAIDAMLKRMSNVVVAAEKRHDISKRRLTAIQLDRQEQLNRLYKEEARARKRKQQ